MNVRDVPADIMRKFKSAVVLQGKTMREVLIELMESYAIKQSEGKK